MTTKAIIDVEVNDGAFARFKAKWDEYNAALAKSPSAWKDIGKATTGAASGFEAGVNALRKQEEGAKRVAAAEDKVGKSVSRMSSDWRNMARDSKEFASNIGKATTSLLKWTGLTGVISGVLGAGGLFGIDRMAASVAGGRRSALGLGVGYGEQQAFGVNFQRFFDANGVLGKVADAKSDWSKRWAFSALGVGQGDVNSKDPAALSADIARRAKTLFDASDQSQQFAQAHGLLEFFTMEDLRRLHNMSRKELDQASRGFDKDATGLGLSPRTQRAWQDFTTQLMRAGAGIENTFVEGLKPLARPLGELSSAFEKTLAAFLKSDVVRDGIKALSGGLETFAKYVGTPEFEANVKSFVDDLGKLVEGLGAAAKWIAKWAPGVSTPSVENNTVFGMHEPDWLAGIMNWNPFGPKSSAAAAATLSGSGIMDGRKGQEKLVGATQSGGAWASGAVPQGAHADYIREAAIKAGVDPAAMLRVYAGEGRTGYVGDDNSSFGDFQLHYGGVSSRFPNSGLGDEFTKATHLDARDKSTWQAQADWVANYAKIHQSWAKWSSMKGHENEGFGPARAAAAPAAQSGGQRVTVEVVNNTGGSAITTVSQLPH